MTEAGLAGFLDRLASTAPTPAGGAAAAMTGALGAALVAMVCRVMARRSPDAALPEVEQEAEALRVRLTALVEADTDAYTAVIQARRGADAVRALALRTALVRATEIPLEIARAAARLLELCDRVAPSARPSTVSDLGVAVALAGAALEGAALTARVNLRELDDRALVSQIQATLAILTDESAATRHRVARVVAARTGGEPRET